MASESILKQIQEFPCKPAECRQTDGEHTCYAGQWTVHGPHDYEVRRQAWRGGGTGWIHCAGKTEATKIRD